MLARMLVFSPPAYRDIATFFLHAEQMEKAGVPLRQMLESAAKDNPRPVIARACQWMLQEVQAGKTLSEAMARHPYMFNGTMISLVAAGERTGRLAQALGACFHHCVQMEDFKKDIRRATRGVKISFIIILLLLILVGKLAAPVATAYLALLAGALVALFRLVPSLKRFSDYLFLVTPELGDFIRHLEMARFAETLALYYDAGVPLREALPEACKIVQNHSMRAVLEKASQRVAQGMPLAEAFQGMPRPDPYFLIMLAAGEKSGNLSATLRESAQFDRNAMADAMDGFRKLATPFLTVLLGGVVFFAFL